MLALRKRIPALFSVFAILLASLAIAPAAEAAVVKPIDLVKVHFDPAGRDRMNNAGYNQEFFQIKNTGTRTVDLTGYTVKDKGTKHTFRFPKGTKIAKGATITVRSGKGRNTSSTLYFQTSTYVWNNDGDEARLYNNRGQLVEKCGLAAA